MGETTKLLLLPGLDGTEIFFAPLRAALPPWIEAQVVTYPTRGPNGYDDLLPLVERAVAAVGRCFVLGWSFAGPLALMAAAARPDSIRGVILCASFVRAPRPGLVRWRFLVAGPVVALVRGFRRARLRLFGHPTRELWRAKVEAWRRVDSRELAARARAALGVDCRPQLKGCFAPLLYVAASHDDVIPRRAVDDLLAVRPDVEVATIDGPHLALYVNPTQAAARIAAFMTANASASVARGAAPGGVSAPSGSATTRARG